jgi:putative NADH-flavin reductase
MAWLNLLFYILLQREQMILPKKVAVIGGTGKAGKYLVKQLIAQGYPIKFLHRKPETLQMTHPLIEIIKGDARDANTIHTLLQGCDAVISCLSQPVGETPVFTDATENILRAMQANSIIRYMVIAGLNVDAPTDNKSLQTQAGTNWMKANYPLTTANRQLEYELLANSSIEWTMVRLPLIIQTDDTATVTINLSDCPGNSISATDLAIFLVGQLENKTYIRKAPFIANV